MRIFRDPAIVSISYDAVDELYTVHDLIRKNIGRGQMSVMPMTSSCWLKPIWHNLHEILAKSHQMLDVNLHHVVVIHAAYNNGKV